MDRLQESLREAPIVEKEGYHYFVHPITDGVPALEPGLLREVVVGIVRKADLEGVDKIVAPEAMGIHIGTALSLSTDLPVAVARKRQYGLDGEVSVFQETGYGESQLYVNDVDEGDRVLVVDDVLSTGGTLSALLGALEETGAEIADVVVAIGKVDDDDELPEFDYPVKTLIDVDVRGGEVVVVDSEGSG